MMRTSKTRMYLNGIGAAFAVANASGRVPREMEVDLLTRVFYFHPMLKHSQNRFQFHAHFEHSIRTFRVIRFSLFWSLGFSVLKPN